MPRPPDHSFAYTLEAELRTFVTAIVREVLAEERRAPTHVTVAAFARRLSVSERTVRDAIAEGRLDHVRIGRAVRIPADAKIEPRIDVYTARAQARLLGDPLPEWAKSPRGVPPWARKRSTSPK